MLPETGHRMPAFVNLQQYYVEDYLAGRAAELPGIDLRWDNEVTGLLSLRTAMVASAGGHPTIEGALTKLFSSEAYVRAADACQSIAGPDGLLQLHVEGAAGDGWIDWAARDAPVTTIYGGTSEIQRNLVAQRGLGLPRGR